MMRLLLVFEIVALLSSILATNITQPFNCPGYDHITCPCGEGGDKVAVSVMMCKKFEPASKADVCEPCNQGYFSCDPCQKFRFCAECMIGLKRCLRCPEGWTGRFCDVAEVQSNGSARANDYFPITIEIPRGKPLSRNRVMRQATGKCKIDVEHLKTVSVKCVLHNNWVTCHLQCIWGYTYPKKVTRDTTCSYTNGNWQPHTLEECKPYVDCNIKIIGAGNVDCFSNNIIFPTYCMVECLGSYISANAKYVCNLDGSYSPSLPHCVKQETKIKTVVPPIC